MLAQAIKPRSQEAEVSGSLEFKARLVYKLSTSTAKIEQKKIFLES